jgi:hypothetical protein
MKQPGLQEPLGEGDRLPDKLLDPPLLNFSSAHFEHLKNEDPHQSP